MKSFRLRLMSQALPFLLVSPGLLALPGVAHAQQPPTAAEAQAALSQPQAVTYSQAELDQMLAPIALYPDQVLMQVLMAATFPQQVIEAGNWLQDQNNAGLKGDALVAALDPLPWDASVKSLVAFPQIVVMMNTHMDWTQSLGVAFAGQQVAVMGEVQILRNRAAAANQFHSNSQIRYVHRASTWLIEPVNPDEIYIPVYNPAVVYGHWAHPDYPPVYVPPPPGFVTTGFNLGPGIGFSVGFGVVAPLYGWGHPDWQRHTVVIDRTRYARITNERHETDNHITTQNNVWHRTAPVAIVAAPSRREPSANAPRPPGTAEPAAVHAPPAQPGRPGEEHRATPAQGQPAPNEAHPAPGAQPGHPPEHPTPPGNEAHPTPGTGPGHGPEHPTLPGNEARPAPGAQPGHPTPPGNEAHPTPGTGPGHPPANEAHPGPGPALAHPPEHPNEAHPAPGGPPHPGPEATHPAEPARPAEHAAPSHPAEAPHPAAVAPHPAEAPHPAAAPPRPAEAPHPAAAPPHPAEAPHPAAAPPHPAEPPHPAAAPPHPAEPPHPAAAPPHPAAPPPAAHPPEPPKPAAPAGKPEEKKEEPPK